VIRFVTTNDGKFREVSQLMAASGIALERMDRAYPEVQADSLEDVVAYGLEILAAEIDGDFFVDDSGLFIDALNGFPGVYSSHAFRKIGIAGLLCLMHSLEDRRAHFETVVGLRRQGETHVVKGTCPGTIAEAARGFNGFGFDPIFIPAGQATTFAEMTTEEKNAVSHRGKAAIALAGLLKGR
jgi:XTP/dITP diphosphohydrolase